MVNPVFRFRIQDMERERGCQGKPPPSQESLPKGGSSLTEGGIPKMAHYLVTARPRGNALEELSKKLRGKAYASMRPFGRAMTYSLENARIRDDGYAAWEEEDYCFPPLAQERAAALDEFFDDLEVRPVRAGAGWAEIEGLPRLFPDLGDRS
jgi:hypothetical protein